MMKVLAIALALPLAACVVGNGDPLPSGGGGDDTGGGGGGGGGSAGGGGGSNNSTTNITADTTWEGNMTFTTPVTIAAGVTVTVSPGADIQFGTNSSLTISGTLDAAGVTGAGNMVTLEPTTGNASFGGISILAGGAFTAKYTVLTGAEVETMTGGTTTVNDSQFSHSPGDLLIMSGGSVTFMYSIVGSATGTAYQEGDTTHCDMHFGGSGNTINVSHSNVTTSAYGVMFYAGTSAVFTYNNWSKNTTNIDPAAGVSGDFSNGYFDTAPPMVAGLTYTNISTTTMLPACDGTNDATCAGPHP
jgi:hypothetical protein